MRVHCHYDILWSKISIDSPAGPEKVKPTAGNSNAKKAAFARLLPHMQSAAEGKPEEQPLSVNGAQE